jgi:hypothetical protein
MSKMARLNTIVIEAVKDLVDKKETNITPEIITRILIDKKKMSEESFNSNVFSQVKTIMKELN